MKPMGLMIAIGKQKPAMEEEEGSDVSSSEIESAQKEAVSKLLSAIKEDDAEGVLKAFKELHMLDHELWDREEEPEEEDLCQDWSLAVHYEQGYETVWTCRISMCRMPTSMI